MAERFFPFLYSYYKNQLRIYYFLKKLNFIQIIKLFRFLFTTEGHVIPITPALRSPPWAVDGDDADILWRLAPQAQLHSSHETTLNVAPLSQLETAASLVENSSFSSVTRYISPLYT